jgi:hypothetical protein
MPSLSSIAFFVFLLFMVTSVMAAIYLIAMLILDAILNKEVTEGTIVEKTHEPARTATFLEPMRTGTANLALSRSTYFPEDWKVVIEGEKGRQRTVSLDPLEWTSVNIGDHYQCK